MDNCPQYWQMSMAGKLKICPLTRCFWPNCPQDLDLSRKNLTSFTDFPEPLVQGCKVPDLDKVEGIFQDFGKSKLSKLQNFPIWVIPYFPIKEIPNFLFQGTYHLTILLNSSKMLLFSWLLQNKIEIVAKCRIFYLRIYLGKFQSNKCQLRIFFCFFFQVWGCRGAQV